jgi:hypothetical protein
MYCQKCGKELAPDAVYCHSCGARVGAYSPADWWWGWRRERLERRDWEPADMIWGAIRGVGFLIIIGLTIFYYPNVFTLLDRYLESWGTYGHPVLPPLPLGQVMIFLFIAGGVWGLVSSGLRAAFSTRFARPLREAVGAVFSLFLALILTQFYARAISGAGLVLLFFVGLAVMVLANALIRHFVPFRKPPG